MRDRTPEALRAEQAVLGCILLHPSKLGEAAVLEPEMFQAAQNARIFRLMRHLAGMRLPYTMVGLFDHFQKHGGIEQVDGMGYLLEVENAACIPTAMRASVEAVRRASVERRALGMLDEVRTRLVAGEDPTTVAAQLGRVLGELTGAESMPAWSDAIEAELEDIQAEYSGQKPPAMSTGWVDLDDQLSGGLRPGELVILAGRPAMGKTACLLNWSLGMAEQHIPTGILSLEMPISQLLRRTLAGSGVVLDRCMQPQTMEQEDFDVLVDFAAFLKALPIEVDDRGGLTAAQVRARCQEWAARGVRVVFLDYLGKMSTAGAESRTIGVGANVSALKDIAKDLGIAIVALHQLNRDVEKRSEKVPMLADLRDSGEIEQEADTVVFVYRPAYYEKNKDPRLLELHVAKARMGRLGSVELDWNGALQTVTNRHADVLGGSHAAK